MNVPYIKKYNENGELSNPIIGRKYPNPYPNRSARHKKAVRFAGNGKKTKGAGLSVYKDSKFRRIIQVIRNARGKIDRQIGHYLMVA